MSGSFSSLASLLSSSVFLAWGVFLLLMLYSAEDSYTELESQLIFLLISTYRSLSSLTS